jgi:hypothetical protein
VPFESAPLIHWIEFDVSAHRKKVGDAINQCGFITPFIYMDVMYADFAGAKIGSKGFQFGDTLN